MNEPTHKFGKAVMPDPREREQEDAMLRAIVEGVEAETGDRFFSSLVRHLAAALGVQYSFVSEFSECRTRFRTLAVWGRGSFLPNFEIPLVGTPCEAVLNGQAAHHPQDLQALFPADTGLVDWGAKSYCGVPLLDSSGTVVGHLAVIDDKPMPDGSRGIAIMRIFAARALAEIERLRVESALRREEERFRDLYEEAPVAYVSVATDGRIRRANRRAVELFGYTRDELIGRAAFDLYAETPNGKPKAREVFRRFLAGQETTGEEMECRTADGCPVWVSLSVKPMRDAQGRIVATRSTLVDITDRKRAEAALRDSEQRLSRIVESAMDAIVTIDQEERIVLFNTAAEKIFRCSATEAIGQPFGRFLTDRLRATVISHVQTFARGDSGERHAWVPEGLTALRADGEEFPVEATLSQVEVGGRNLYTLILRDIEERKRAEAQLQKLQLANVYLQEEIRTEHNFNEIAGSSPALLDVFRKVEQVAPTDSTVLIYGETGTGKELIARAIHDRSPRKDRPLVKVNCSAISAGLVESELFGHVKGAFTGALERHIGRFELADGGTIFLDEVGELPLDTQVKLLRVLQEQEFEPVGSSRTIRVNVRVIAATNRDLEEAIRAGRFRSDLFYRLNVFPIEVPPLRARRVDIPQLVMFFLERFAKKFGKKIDTVSSEAMNRLVSYSWPGNIRELQNIIERAVVLLRGPVLELPGIYLPGPESSAPPEPETLVSAAAASAPASHGSQLPSRLPSLEQMERNHILSALQQTGWVIEGPKGAASILDLHPNTLRSRMARLGIKRPAHEQS